MKKAFVFCLVILTAIGIFLLTGKSQAEDSIFLSGTITDQNGHPLSSVSITAKETSSRLISRAISDSKGCYRFPGLSPGFYDVHFEIQGFKPAFISGVEVIQQRWTELNAVMSDIKSGIKSMAEINSIGGVMGGVFSNQLSFRFKSELINKRGSGWNLLIDSRDRLRIGEEPDNHVLLYDARVNFEKTGSPLYISLGQMNLYDTAGIGQLLGGALGIKLKTNTMIGAYAGLDSNAYINRIDSHFFKFGLFARYLGTKGKRILASFNQLSYSGSTERQYIYTGTLFPVSRSLVIYGNVEYELASQVRKEDRLSRMFTNVRWNPVEIVDLTVHYSSGKGLDFHRYLTERSQDPTLSDQQLERYYYSKQYGLRVSLKPQKGLRFYIARQESEQKDLQVRNHTWRFGASAGNLFKTGISAYGNYSVNRGEISESNSYHISLTKNIGPASLNFSFSNTFNGIRYDSRTGNATIIHLNDHKTLSTNVFISFSRLLAVSAEYQYFLQKDVNQHLFFLRLMLRY
ncbi:carboxypeptidase-like regulatory domain-containing protein [Acidobacteriota bacterium]